MTDSELKVFLEIAERAGTMIADNLSSEFRRIFGATVSDGKKYDFCPICEKKLDEDGDCMNLSCPYNPASAKEVSRFVTDAIRYACKNDDVFQARLLQIRENIKNNEY